MAQQFPLAHSYLESIEASNLPKSEKRSLIRHMIDSISTGKAPRLAKHHIGEGLDFVRGAGTSLIAGGALGAIHAHAKNGLNIGGKVPADLLLGIVAPVVGSAMHEHPAQAETAKDIGKTGLSVFGFREVFGLIAEKKMQAGGLPGGSFKSLIGQVASTAPKSGASAHGDGEDPILAIAKKRGFGKQG